MPFTRKTDEGLSWPVTGRGSATAPENFSSPNTSLVTLNDMLTYELHKTLCHLWDSESQPNQYQHVPITSRIHMFSFSWGIYWFWIASLVYFIKNSIVKLRIIFSIIMDKILAFFLFQIFPRDTAAQYILVYNISAKLQLEAKFSVKQNCLNPGL